MLTENQKLMRRNGIGGSDMPIILGLSSYMTPYQLFLEKRGLIERQPETEMQRWGNILEPVIREEFARRHEVVVETPDTIIDPFVPYMLANVDGLIPEWNAVLEIKTANPYMQKEWDDAMDDGIPLAYMSQVAHYCAVTGSSKAYVSVFIGTHDYREFVYLRQPDIEKTIYDAAEKFWNAVQSGIEPDMRTIEDLRLRYKQSSPEPKMVTDKVNHHLTELANAKLKCKELESAMEQHKFEIMSYLAESDCLVGLDGKPVATWKANKKGVRTFLLKGI